jgi:hypothetical protein
MIYQQKVKENEKKEDSLFAQKLQNQVQVPLQTQVQNQLLKN